MAVNEDNGRLKFEAILNDANFRKGIEDIVSGVKRTTSETEKATKKQQNSWNSLGKTMGSFGSLFKTMLAGFGIITTIQGVFTIIKSGVQDMIAFDKAMVNMSAIAGKSRSELKGLEADIRKVASESLNSATAVAEMATELIKLGTTPEGVRNLLKPVNDLSIASQMSADATAILLKGTLNAYQETEDQAQRYADVIAQSLNATALDAQKFGDAFTYIASTANVAGYSIEETAAMIGVLVDNNVQASSAGRVLSSVFGRLAKGGKELESELEKIRNSQDKLAQASKIFGAEGARLGVILANNKDRLAELTKEFENSNGALKELTDKQLESVSAKLEILKSGWQEFILSVENGQGRLAIALKFVLDVVTDLIGGLALLAKSNKEIEDIGIGNLADSDVQWVKTSVDEYIKQRKRRFKEEGKIYTEEMQMMEEKEKREKEIAWKQAQTGKELIKLRTEEAQINAKTVRNRQDLSRIKEIDQERKILEANYNALAKYGKEANQIVVGTDEITKKTGETSEDILKKRLALLDKIDKAERSINESVLGGREGAVQKVLDKYIELNKEAVKLGMNTKKINDLQVQELAVVNYKSDTDNLKDSLAEQKSLYDEYEKAKKDVGEEQAKEMYSNLIDLSKSYYDVLGEELDKIDVNTMEAKERNRYGMLTQLLGDYVGEKDKKEREQLQNLINETRNTEEKITQLKREYEQKRLNIANNFTGQERDNRLKQLERTYSKDISGLFDGFLQEEGFATKIATAVTSATKESILAQIQSLRGFLNTTKDLTKEQVSSIMLTIGDLENKLSTATSSTGQKSSRLSLLNNQIQQLKDARKALMDAIALARERFGSEASVEIQKLEADLKGVNVQLDNLGGEKALAIAEVFGDMSNTLSEMSNNFKGINDGASKMFSTMSKISSLASQVNSSVGNMSNHMKAVQEGTSDFSTALSGVGSYFGMIMSFANTINDMDAKRRSREKQEEREMYEAQNRRILSEVEWQRKLSEIEIERARRNSIGLAGSKKQIEAILNSINKGVEGADKIWETLSDPNRIVATGDYWSKYLKYGGISNLIDYPDTQKKLTNKEVEDRLALIRDEISKLQNLYEQTGDLNYLKHIEYLEKVEKYYSSAMFFQGKTWREVEEALATGKIYEYNVELAKSYVEIGKSAEEAGYNIDDLHNAMREMATGTSIDELSESLAEAFKNGEDAVYSFGQTMEEVLKNAVVSAFKNEYIVKEMDELFKMFGDMGLDGQYTQEELDEIRKQAEESAKRLQDKWDALNTGLDLDFTSSTLGSQSAKDGIKRITETQADRLTGILTGVQADVIQIRQIHKDQLNALIVSNNLLNSSYQTLISIEAHTRRGADGIESIDGKMDLLINTAQNNQNRALGL